MWPSLHEVLRGIEFPSRVYGSRPEGIFPLSPVRLRSYLCHFQTCAQGILVIIVYPAGQKPAG